MLPKFIGGDLNLYFAESFDGTVMPEVLRGNIFRLKKKKDLPLPLKFEGKVRYESGLGRGDAGVLL